MFVEIKATNFKLTPQIERLVNKKLSSLRRLLKQIPEDRIKWFVEVGKTTQHHRTGRVWRAELMLVIPAHRFRAEAVQDNLKRAIDEARQRLEEEMRREKDKDRRRALQGARRVKALLQRGKLI